jgi:prolyl-tRNA synthetase
MRWSQIFIPTLRDDPADAEAISHKLMLRAGLVRQLAAGVYSKLPLGLRAARKVEAIVREEMERIGGQEFHLPVLHPGELWKESGRWFDIGEEMFRLKDRRQGDYCLGMTHEEVFTSIARDELRSYRQLPQIWFQIQTKFRDEARPKSGVLRGREFVMKDSYTFDVDFAGLDVAFDKHADAYRRIFARCGVKAFAVQASSGAMGGSESIEFMSVSDAGEDWTVTCASCDYAANVEKATSIASLGEFGHDDAVAVEKFPTPGIRTIDALAAFDEGATPERQIKTLVYFVEEQPALFLLRGDHTLNEVKLSEATGTTNFRPATPEECQQALGALPGSLGAVGVSELPIYADDALKGRRGMVTGANEDDFHLRHVSVERDLGELQWTSLRDVVACDRCVRCGEALAVKRTIELGHIFKLGLRYSEAMKLNVLNEQGREVPVVMGSYGIGIERLVAAVIEAYHDDNGIVWPWSVAPFHIVVTPISLKDASALKEAEELYSALGKDYEVLIDDRDERPGVKFKDADLIGIPLRIVVGPKGLEKGVVELFERGAQQKEDVLLERIVDEVRARVERLAAAEPR